MSLRDLDETRRILELEDRYPRHTRAKELAILRQFGISATRFYARVDQLLDDPEAWKVHPAIWGSLHSRRERRRERCEAIWQAAQS